MAAGPSPRQPRTRVVVQMSVPGPDDALLDSLGVSVAVTNEQGVVVEVNQATCALTGYNRDRLIGSPASLFVQPDLLDDQRWATPENSTAMAGHYKHQTGAAVPVSFKTKIVSSGDSANRYVVFYAVRATLPQEHEASQSRIRDFAKASSDWYWETGVDGQFTYVSDSIFDAIGVNPDDLIGRYRSDFINEDERTAHPAKWDQHLEDIKAKRPFRDLSYAFKGGDDRVRHIKISGVPFFNAEGQYCGYRGCGTDATEAVAAEVALKNSAADLRESKHKLTSLMNAVPHAVVTIDMSCVIHTFNPAAERIFGYSVAEAVGQNVNILMPGDVGNRHDGFVRSFMETGDSTIFGKRRELTAQRKDGSQFPLEIAVNWMEVSDGVMFVGVCQDITHRKKAERERAELEQELLHSHKMESLGTLSGGIAHEINTPLQYVGDNIRFLHESFTDLGAVLLSYAELMAAAAKVGPLTA